MRRLAFLAFFLGLSGCGDPNDLTGADIDIVDEPFISGADQRIDVYQSTDPALRNFARSVGSLWGAREPGGYEGYLDNGDGTTSLTRYNRLVCSDEAYAKQQTGARLACSAFLVAPDIIATASHCLKANFQTGVRDPSLMRFIFGFQMIDANNLAFPSTNNPQKPLEVKVNNTDVYTPTTNLFEDTVADYLLLRLDRPVTDTSRPILPMAPSGALAAGGALKIFGHPSSLPQKISSASLGTIYDYLITLSGADSYVGNSGGPVIDASMRLAGILNSSDFVEDYETVSCTNDLGQPIQSQRSVHCDTCNTYAAKLDPIVTNVAPLGIKMVTAGTQQITVSSAALAEAPNGVVLAVIRGSNDQIYFSSCTGPVDTCSWSSWSSLGTLVLTDAEPSVTYWQNKFYIAVKRKTNNYIAYTTIDPTTLVWAAPWSIAGGNMSSGPVVTKVGNFLVFMATDAASGWLKATTVSPSGTWTSFAWLSSLGTTSAPAGSPVTYSAAGLPPSDVGTLFAIRASDGSIYTMRATADASAVSWGTFTQVAGSVRTRSSPQVIADRNNVSVLVRDTNDKLEYVRAGTGGALAFSWGSWNLSSAAQHRIFSRPSAIVHPTANPGSSGNPVWLLNLGYDRGVYGASRFYNSL